MRDKPGEEKEDAEEVSEQIVPKLRQIEVLQGQGKSLAVACKKACPVFSRHSISQRRIIDAWGDA